VFRACRLGVVGVAPSLNGNTEAIGVHSLKTVASDLELEGHVWRKRSYRMDSQRKRIPDDEACDGI